MYYSPTQMKVIYFWLSLIIWLKKTVFKSVATYKVPEAMLFAQWWKHKYYIWNGNFSQNHCFLKVYDNL